MSTIDAIQELNSAGVTTANIPITATTGNLMLVFVSNYNGAGQNLAIPSGWTRLALSAGTTVRPSVFAKISDGTEGSTVAVQTTSVTAFDCSAKSFSISDWSGTLDDVDVATVVEQAASASISSVDPAEITAAWGAEANNLFFVAGFSARGNNPFTVTPSGYTSTSGFSGLDGSGYSAHISVGYKAANAASDDPSVYTSATYQHMVAVGIVVRGVAPTTLTCDSITGGTIRAGDTVRIDLSNSPGASGYVLSTTHGALTATAETATYVEFTAFNPRTFGDKTADYNTPITVTVSLSGESDTISFQIAPDVGYETGTITALEGIYAEPEFSGVAITDVYYTATISGADFTVGAVPVLGTEQTFNLWIQDQTDGVWGSPFVVTIPASGGGSEIPAASRADVWKIGRYLQSTGSYNSAGINEIVMEWLIAEGIGRSQLNYMLYLYLEGLGYTGTLNDKLRKWSLDP